MHRVFKAETTRPPSCHRRAQQRRTDRWVNVYNRIVRTKLWSTERGRRSIVIPTRSLSERTIQLSRGLGGDVECAATERSNGRGGSALWEKRSSGIR